MKRLLLVCLFLLSQISLQAQASKPAGSDRRCRFKRFG